MYTQNSRRAPGGVPIPENYSGNAFSDPPGEGEGARGGSEPPIYEEVRGFPMPTVAPNETPPENAVIPVREAREGGQDGGDIPEQRHGGGKDSGLGFPLFSRGFGSEEMLIVGLMLLLGGEVREGGEDCGSTLLYLLLLLFCG